MEGKPASKVESAIAHAHAHPCLLHRLPKSGMEELRAMENLVHTTGVENWLRLVLCLFVFF